jgi:hypothetical protein
MKHLRYVIPLLLFIWLFTACGPVSPDMAATQTQVPLATHERQVVAPVDTVRQILAGQLDVPPDDIRVVSSEQVDWPDGCLGVQSMGVICAQVVTPGYKIVLEAVDQFYEYHTNLDGSLVKLASAPDAPTSEPLLIWQTDGQPCQTVQLRQDSLSFGDCGNPLLTLPWGNQRQLDRLTQLVSEFATFEALTPAGQITLDGQGELVPSPAEQRGMAEWANLIFMESQGVRGGAAWGLAMSWHRAGGIAGFCDDLGVYRSGEVFLTNCKDGPQTVAHTYLSATQLDQLYQYLDAYQNFEYDFSDPAVADALTITMLFSGVGDQQPSAAEQRAVADFAAGLVNDLQLLYRPDAERNAAEAAMRQYFAALAQADYAKVIQLYGGSYETLQNNNPDVDATDKPTLWQRGCEQNGLQCLPLRAVLAARPLSDSSYQFEVEFSTQSGELFQQGPCCGDVGQPNLRFTYTVSKQAGTWKVQELPPYIP